MKGMYQVLGIMCATLIFAQCYATDIGSDTTVNRFDNQVVLMDGDRIAGFAALAGGLKFDDDTVTGIFDSFFRVSGDIDLNGGTLQLERDFIMSNTATISRSGNIIGNNHQLEVSPTVSSIPSEFGYCYDETHTWTNIKVVLNCNVTFKECTYLFQGNSSINGQGHCLILDPDCTFVVDSNATLLLKDITIKDVHGTNIQCTDSTSTVSLQDVTWVLDNDYSFTVGKFVVLKDFDVVGDGYEFAYESDAVSTIEKCGCMTLHQGVTLRYESTASDSIQLVESMSKLALCGATLNVKEPGWQLTKGTFVVKNRSFISTDDYGPLTFGDGSDYSNNLNVQIFPAANLEITNGCLLYNNV